MFSPHSIRSYINCECSICIKFYIHIKNIEKDDNRELCQNCKRVHCFSHKSWFDQMCQCLHCKHITKHSNYSKFHIDECERCSYHLKTTNMI